MSNFEPAVVHLSRGFCPNGEKKIKSNTVSSIYLYSPFHTKFILRRLKNLFRNSNSIAIS